TALRDGMYLVAKEYVASRPDLRGVLVLSEFAGAADELRASVRVNPHDIDELKSAILRALAMPEEEQEDAMVSLRHQVVEHDVQAWAHSFLEELEQVGRPVEEPTAPIRLRGDEPSSPEQLAAELETFASIPRILVASDFDGVLAPIVADRDAVEPDAAALGLLHELSDMPGVSVALVSGRALADLDAPASMPRSVVLVASDFDGVLAPVVADRAGVEPDAAALGLLHELSDMPGVSVALVSGRALAGLDAHASMPSSVVLVGSHGAEVGALPPWMHAE